MKPCVFLVFMIIFLFVSQPAAKAVPCAAVETAVNIRDEDEKEKEKEKKKQEEKEKEKTKKKVWTNEDLKNIKGANITYVETDPEAKKTSGKNTSKDKKPAKTQKKVDRRETEEYWQNRKKEIVTRIENSQAKIKEMREELSQLQLQQPATDILGARLAMEKRIRELQNSILNYERGLMNLEKSLEDLKQEARKAGVPPGWLR